MAHNLRVASYAW